MIHEFALEPDVVSNWQDFRYFIEKFGAEHGRLISQFPKKWKRYVIEASTETGVNRTRIVERLRTIDHKLLRSGRPYDPEQPWLHNAVVQHETTPFQGIIARANPAGHTDVMEADIMDGTEPRWAVPRERLVRRQAADLAASIGPLMRASKEIILVDPHLHPTKIRYQRSLRALFAQGLSDPVSISRLEIHVEALEGEDESRWQHHCETCLLGLLPDRMELTLFRWRQLPDSDTLHPRYVLTDIGGLRVEHGLDEGETGETTDISLLSEYLHARRLEDYDPATTPFELVDRITIRR